ncbi:MAG: CHRD domain-containing protein, partial [Bacteroidota bacterium]
LAHDIDGRHFMGEGLGIFTISFNKKSMVVDVSVAGLTGDITGIHIHEGTADENGPVIINLTDFIDGNRVKTTLSDLSAGTMAKFLTGAYYLNVHTEANPGGEIRAQILLETDFHYTARLNGAQEVPAVDTDASGLAVFNLSKSGYKLEIRAIVEGLSGPISGAHLHAGAAGTNGGVVENLTTSVTGNIITALVDPEDYLAELMAGDIYLNVHTLSNPGGEIRGQLMLTEGLHFDAFLSGNQEVPVVPTIAEGVASFEVSPTLDSMTYEVLVDGLSGPITGAHLHEGAAGTNGGVLVNLTEQIDSFRISGTLPITIDLLNKMLTGTIYLNIHTELNPGGEIRGQVYKLAREAYSYEFSGGQEVPATDSPGTGAGMVTIDRDQTNAHFMMVVSGLGEGINAAHFHQGSPGENGGVIFNLTPFLTAAGGAYGYWTEENDPAFGNSPMFRSNNVYVNIHTDNFPSGAIRANVVRSRDFFATLPIDPGFGADLLLAARLNGGNEVPAVETDAVGVAAFLLNDSRDSILINISVNGLSGSITGAHLHEGAPDENGDVVFNLTDDIIGNRISTTLTGFSAQQLATMIHGGYYLNVHTADNPAGEIRGQVVLETDDSYRADLSGANEVPAVTGSGFGLATAHYTKVVNQLEINVLVDSLSGPITGAHLHLAQAGMNGDVVEDLSAFVRGNQIVATVFPDSYAADLKAGNIYLNIHTEANPAGELRGQLMASEGLSFDTWLMGAQEVPAVATAAMGLASVHLSAGFDSLSYRIVTNNMSGNILGAHFHSAALGANGGVILDLSSDINGPEVEGSLGASAISSDIVNTLLSGDSYLNLHTAAHMGGEVRGQVYRLARDGYQYDLCPAQEVPAVTNAPDATGAGMASIDRRLSNVHIMAVVSGLTDTITGMHIHEGEAGTNGGVIFNLTPLVANGGVFAYWSGMDEMPFDTAFAKSMQAGNTYLNVHTDINPGGEVRGQIVKESNCPFTTSTEELAPVFTGLQMFPNPANAWLQLRFDQPLEAAAELTIYNVAGQRMQAQRIGLATSDLSVDIDDLPAGMYYLELRQNSGSHTLKFVKGR